MSATELQWSISARDIPAGGGSGRKELVVQKLECGSTGANYRPADVFLSAVRCEMLSAPNFQVRFRTQRLIRWETITTFNMKK